MERQERTGSPGAWWLAAIAALTLAALVKAPALLLLPAYLVLIARPRDWRHNGRRRHG